MKKIKMKNRKGLTLIEVTVSLAIIGMIALFMLNIFGTGLLNITRAGNRTVNNESARNNFILNPEPISQEIILNINLGVDSDDYVEVKGRMGKGAGTMPENYGNIKVEIESFVPGL